MINSKKDFLKGTITGIVACSIFANINTFKESSKNIDIDNIESVSVSNIDYSKYKSSWLYKNLAPNPTTNYFIETPILNALVEDMNWSIIENNEEANSGITLGLAPYYYSGVFENWTNIPINEIEFELVISTADDVVIKTLSTSIYDIEPEGKVYVNIPLSTNKIVESDDIKLSIKATSRDFKDKPFKKSF